MPIDSRLLCLHAADNVLTATRTLEAGSELLLQGTQVVLAERIELGHKVASCAIAAGEKIIKYGVPIGSATQAIAVGEHVHTRNLRSDYLPTWSREDQDRLFAMRPEVR